MPWTIRKQEGRWAVVKATTGEMVPGGSHATKQEALDHANAIRAGYRKGKRR